MSSYSYSNGDTTNAAYSFWNYSYNQCQASASFIVKLLSTLLGPFGCDYGNVCNNAAAMVLNCTVAGGSECGNNDNALWTSLMTAGAYGNTISPDRLGGLTRFMNEAPRPTTWAADSQHLVTWSGAGKVCGCFE
jgi:hypothetical protein